MNMNPERVIEIPEIRTSLLNGMVRFGNNKNTAYIRSAILNNAGLVLPQLKVDDSPIDFATNLVSLLISKPLSEKSLEKHDLIKLFDYFYDTGVENYGFIEQDFDLFSTILIDIKKRVNYLSVRNAVVGIENENKETIGTGILTTDNYVLTCKHIITKSRINRAWVRMGYHINWDNRSESEGYIVELDFDQIVYRGGTPKYDLIIFKLSNHKSQAQIPLRKIEINTGEPVHILYYPPKGPIDLSDNGEIVQVGSDYIIHNLNTSEGASGGPIFSKNWELVAIHRGKSLRTKGELSEGLPIHAVYDDVISSFYEY